MKEAHGPPTMPITIIPLGVKTLNERVYDMSLFENPPLPCYVQLYDPAADNSVIDLSKLVGIMDNLRAEPTQHGFIALVGDFHHLQVPAYQKMREFMDSGYHCTPLGHGKIAADGTVSEYTLLGFGICPAGPPSDTERPA